MLSTFDTFLNDESGTITLDWVVLTAVLVGTGLSVVVTLRSGIETSSLTAAEGLRGVAVRSSFQTELCRGGIAGLQHREDLRVADGGGDAIDVRYWMEIYQAGLSDGAVIDEHRRLQDLLGGVSGDWTRDRTILTALECELVLRGLD